MRERSPRQPKVRLARTGEDHAARYLASRGYRIRERNYRAPGGAEVDIVAEHRGTLVFVEVKSRSSTDFAQPHESVTPAKQRQIARAASAYLAAREGRERLTRFDVVEVLLTPQGRVRRITLTAGAFLAP